MSNQMQVSAGRYAARIVSHKLGKAKSTGNPQIAFVIEVLGKVDPADPENLSGEGAGLTRTVIRTVTDNTIERTWDELDAIGATEAGIDRFTQLDPQLGSKDFVSLAGKEIYVRCTPNEYQGVTRERWELDVFGGQGLQINDLDAAEARELDAKFGRKGRKPAGPGGQRGPAPARQGGGFSAGNTIPF